MLLSGLGFESGGLATAHMIGNLLSNVPECKQRTDARRESRLRHHHPAVPGRRVRRGRHIAIVDFEIEIGLPVTFADLDLADVTRERITGGVGDACAGEGSLCHNHPFQVTAADVVDAMIAADALAHTTRL